MTPREASKPGEDKVLKKIAQTLSELHYGTIQITVHNSRVTQIDKLERVRVLREDYVDAGGAI
ncbi:MAG: YezD family protein [Candidatus Margulisbacteria bacterium]|jgi:hypothetical protein|nr:YezD family protein [Candidatus Margulisiibacteriota bacterium]